MQRGEPSLECALPGGVVRVAAQIVTQQHLIPGRQGTGLDNMQMVRPGAGRAAAVQMPARHPGVVKPIPQQVQVTLSRADPVQITGRSHQIDDRLGSQSGTDVLPTCAIVLNSPDGRNWDRLGVQRTRPGRWMHMSPDQWQREREGPLRLKITCRRAGERWDLLYEVKPPG